MRLAEEFRPRALCEVIGQPVVAALSAWAERPYACSWLLEGPPGTGKTSVAHCLVNELCVDPETDVHMIGCANLNADTVRRLMAGARCRPMFSPWRILIFEEFEQLSRAVQMALKVDLDPANLPSHLITIATSNDVSRIPRAVQQRFGRLRFSGGTDFASQAEEAMRRVWQDHTSLPIPDGFAGWGWDGEHYSLRAAYDKMEVALMLTELGAAVA